MRMRMVFRHLAATLVAVCLATAPAIAASHKEKAPPARPPAAAEAAAGVEAPKQESGIDTQAKHAIVVDADTGAVLLDKAADEHLPTASMSKMMTAYLVFSYLKEGRGKLEDELPISERAWRTGGSKMFVP